MIKDNMTRFEESLNADLGRPVLECRMLVPSSFSLILLTKEPSLTCRLEIIPTIGEVAEQINGVDKWSKPTKPPFSLNFAAMRPLIRHEAKGTVLIISPFNYPIWLSIGPLVRIPSSLITSFLVFVKD
jgi:aldehyde dehydrogenase (NAD+)